MEFFRYLRDLLSERGVTTSGYSAEEEEPSSRARGPP